MPENQPPTDESSTLDQAQPYRSPANLSDGTAKAGAMKSPILWLAALTTTGLVAAGVFSYYLIGPVRDFNENRRPVQPVKEHIEEFGLSRMPIEDFEGLEAVEMLPSEPPISVSNESGEIPAP